MLNWLKNQKRNAADLEKRINELNAEIDRLEQNKISLLEENNKLSTQMSDMRNLCDGFGVLEEIGFERYIPTMYNDDIESKIFDYESKLAKLLGDDKVIIQTREYRYELTRGQVKEIAMMNKTYEEEDDE